MELLNFLIYFPIAIQHIVGYISFVPTSNLVITPLLEQKV